MITGKGSGGKSGFALKLLTMPMLSDEEEVRPELELSGEKTNVFKIDRRILVISFLYESSYYDELLSLIVKRRRFDTSTAKPEPKILLDVMSFYPGFLPPEVFVGKIVQKLHEAILDGFPFDAVLIDGLHNVFLQFPKLQDALMVWPILLEILRIVGVTVVTTHTHFDVFGMGQGTQIATDVEMANRRVAPLLQALINSADYYIDISPQGHRAFDEGKLFKIEIVNAIGQDVAPSKLSWDRAKLYVRSL